jgi:short chain dehydrogenase
VSIGGRMPIPWAAGCTAAKFALAGFTDALRQELGVRSRIAVCGVYPAYVDTPTPVNSGNYTGRSLRPVPPVIAPERVAEAIVGLTRRPRRARRVGTLHALSVPYALAPGTSGRLAARLGRWFFLHAGTPVDPTDGGLFTTRLTAVATRGGWGEPQRTRVRRAVSGIGLVAAAGAAVGLLRYRSASGQAVPRQCDA